MVTTRRLGEMMMILCAQKIGSRLTLVIPRMLYNCGYAWTWKKWAREYQFWEVEDNKSYTSGVEEFGGRRDLKGHDVLRRTVLEEDQGIFVH
jgi:hypothetical protein